MPLLALLPLPLTRTDELLNGKECEALSGGGPAGERVAGPWSETVCGDVETGFPGNARPLAGLDVDSGLGDAQWERQGRH